MPVMMTHDTSIDYDVHGDGPPLILINGLGFGRWGWFKQIPALSRHFRIITFDIRGEHSLAHGVTDLSAEVVALLDHLGIEKTHVLGTSLGGFVAQKLALSRPDLVDRLVLVCTSYGGVGRKPMSFEALGRMLGWGSLRPEDAARRGLETGTSDAYRAGNPDEFDRILRWRLADSPSLSEYSQQMMAGAQFDASRDVGEISSPTLVVHGAEDRYVPLANAVALAESIPNTKLRVLDGAGHLVFIEQAKEVNKEIIAFLKPRKRWRPRIRPEKQKMKRLVERLEKANNKLFPFLKNRKPKRKQSSQRSSAKQETKRSQRGDGMRKLRGARELLQKPKGGIAFGKIEGWLRRSYQVPGDWARKLRGRFPR
jgi:pimeloyl-ACP methyl ester carboxylesterase